jgi:hypothetical protein
MPDNHTNLPILDDIIKPGNSDKAVHQPASKVQSSLWSDEERNDASTDGADAKTSAPPAADNQPDSTGPLTDEHSAVDAIDQNETRPPAIDLPDIDALTEEILDNLILQIEPLLRDRIQQTLSRHLSGETGSD